MALGDLLKKNRVHCPHCSAGFDLGADLEAVSGAAGELLDKLGNFLGGDQPEEESEESRHPWVMYLADEFDVSPSKAQEMLEEALADQSVMDAICDFLEGEESEDDDDN